MSNKAVDWYRREWPRVAAVQAMALGGVSLLAGRKHQKNLRALAVMNAMTMCAHQYEEYVDPGYLPGQINIGMFKSKQPLSWPFNPNGAMCANIFFRAIYVPAMIWPKKKWLGLPPVLLGFFQAFAHGSISIREAMKSPRRYGPGTLTAVMLHAPIGVVYLTALRAQGPISRSDWMKSAGVLGGFFVFGVLTPNFALADRNSPHNFTAKQMGPYLSEMPEGAAKKTTAEPEASDLRTDL
jgi:hypothetical protein